MIEGLLDIPFKAYLADPGIGSHTIMEAGRSLEHFTEARKNGSSKSTPAMLMGRAIHSMVLTPELFTSDFSVCDANSRRTKEYKALEEVTKKEILMRDELEVVNRVTKAVLAHDYARRLTRDAKYREVSGFWDHGGVRCKFRGDAIGELNTGGLILADLKSARSAVMRRGAGGQRSFADACADAQYHVQMAHYIEGIEAVTGRKVEKVVLVVVEKEAPFVVRCYELGAGWLQTGAHMLEGYWSTVHGENKEARGISSLPIPAWLQGVTS